MSHRFSSRLRAVAVSAALAVTSLAPVFAHDMDARLEITAEPATATRSSLALPTFAAYKITITSLETQTLRSVEFTGKTSIVGGSGAATFIEFHLVVPGAITVTEAHAMCDRIEAALKRLVEGCVVTIHVEPEDKAKHSGIIVL